MRKFLFLILCIIIHSCNAGENGTDCFDCDGGIIDGFLYKEVSLGDIASLTEIGISANIGQCIRFKMDDSEFLDAIIVDDCCCSIFE